MDLVLKQVCAETLFSSCDFSTGYQIMKLFWLIVKYSLPASVINNNFFKYTYYHPLCNLQKNYISDRVSNWFTLCQNNIPITRWKEIYPKNVNTSMSEHAGHTHLIK